MTATSGFVVPDNVVIAGGKPLTRQFVADVALSPTNCVKFDTSAELIIVCAVDDEECIGIAGINYKAASKGLDILSAFADGDVVPVHMSDYLVVVADTGALTRGLFGVVGSADGAEVEDTGAVTWEPTIIGRAMTSAATAVKAIIKFF